MLAEYGIPKAIYTDNGKDYLSSGLESVLNVLGIEQNKAKPYHGQSKAIERFFRTFEERFGKCFYSYIGSDGKKRPEHLKKTNKELEKDPNIPSLAVYEERLANYIKEYNSTPHSGNGMNGRTPDEVYYSSFEKPVQMISDEAVLTMLFANSCECKVSNSGVVILGQKFESKELLDLLGKKVIVKYDPEKLDKAYIFTMDGNFYCNATPKVRPFSRAAKEDDFRSAKNMIKHSNKLSRENESYRQRDVRDVMFGNIAEEYHYQMEQAEEFENIHTKKAAEAVSEREEENFNAYSRMYDILKKKGAI